MYIYIQYVSRHWPHSGVGPSEKDTSESSQWLSDRLILSPTAKARADAVLKPATPLIMNVTPTWVRNLQNPQRSSFDRMLGPFRAAQPLHPGIHRPIVMPLPSGAVVGRELHGQGVEIGKGCIRAPIVGQGLLLSDLHHVGSPIRRVGKGQGHVVKGGLPGCHSNMGHNPCVANLVSGRQQSQSMFGENSACLWEKHAVLVEQGCEADTVARKRTCPQSRKNPKAEKK